MITQEYLKSILDYNPDTGEFKWLITKSSQSGAKAGARAGSYYNNYIYIKINQRNYRANKLAWLYIHGEYGPIIDHINRNRLDNRISNLRKATQPQNSANSKIFSNNTSGYKGVSFNKGKWLARIQVEGVRKELGYFDSAEEAHAAYKDAATKLHGEFANPEGWS